MLNLNRRTLVVSILLAGSMPIGQALAQASLGVPTLSVAGNGLSWTPVVYATGYDVVRGDLVALRQSGGDWTSAVRDCLGEDRPAQQLQQPYPGVPKVGEAFFFLVRAVTESEAGSFDSGGVGQQGSRDAEIRAARTACFEPVTSRGGISIDGDGQFTSARGVVGGTGTPADPFLIAGWDIVCGPGPDERGIEISNTTAAFVIRDVRVRSCPEAIVLDGAGNASVERSRMSGGDGGVALIDCNGIALEGNRFGPLYGTAIAVLGGGGHVLRRNTITQAAVGIDLENAENVIVYRNNLIDNATQAIAHDGCCNEWSQPLPDGGNYWSDYTGSDSCAGLNQDLCDPYTVDRDGIGDQPRPVPDVGSDLYPFMTTVSDDGDTLPPSVTTTWPWEGSVLMEPELTVHGIAEDAGVGVDHIEIRLNGGAWTQVPGILGWSSDVVLALGENQIELAAVDRVGNRSPADVTTVVYRMPAVWATSIQTSQASYPPGVPVPITLRVTNTSAWEGILTFMDTCEASFTVANAGGTVIYDRRAHQICFQASYTRSVAGGETLTYNLSWTQVNDQGAQVMAPANYTIRGFLRSVEPVPDRSTPVTIDP